MSVLTGFRHQSVAIGKRLSLQSPNWLEVSGSLHLYGLRFQSLISILIGMRFYPALICSH